MNASTLKFYSGQIEFHEDLPLESIISSSSNTDILSCPDYNSKSQKERLIKGNKVCLLLLPSHMIPCDILKYFTKSYLDTILSMQILKHIDKNDDKYLALLELETKEDAVKLIRDYDQQILSSLEQIPCILYSVKTVKLATADGNNLEYSYNCDINEKMSAMGSSKSPEIFMHSPSSSMVRKSRSSSLMSSLDVYPPNTASSSLNNREHETDHFSPLEELFCPVCLEQIDFLKPYSFTTACHHTYHIDCIKKLEGPQCPVCSKT
jgi:hypothetical protein